MRLLLLLPLFATAASAAEPLTRDSFLEQVRARNGTYHAVTKIREASRLDRSQVPLLTAPEVFFSGSYLDDKSPTFLDDYQGTERRLLSLQSGLQMQTTIGLQGKLFFRSDAQRTFGARLLGPGQDSLMLQSYGVELKVPLWRNGLGRDVRFRRDIVQETALAGERRAEVDLLDIETRASLVYLQLAKARQTKDMYEKLLVQGDTLVAWVKARVASRLLEGSDLAQAQSALTAWKLKLEQAILEEESLRRDFNSLRESSPEEPVPELTPLDEYEKLAVPPAKLGIRKEVLAQQAALAAERKDLEARRESVLPDVSLTARMSSYVKQSSINDTARCSDPTACSQLYLGLNATIPLDLNAASEASDGIRRRIHSRELTASRAEFEARAQLEKTRRTWELLGKQLALARQLVENRDQRLREERKRQRLGRSSTADLIEAEHDLAEAELKRLGLLYSLLEVWHQFRYYEETT